MGADGARMSPGDFFDEVAALMLADDPRVVLLGPVQPSAHDYVRPRAALTRSTVWNMQYASSLTDLRAARPHGPSSTPPPPASTDR